jgi:archaellum biogenesis ATPase FlaH
LIPCYNERVKGIFHLSQEDITPLFFEKLLIHYLFKDVEIREKVIPYLDPKVFNDSDNIDLVKNVSNFVELHEKFPTVNDLKVFAKAPSTVKHLLDIMNIDTSEFDRTFILGELEEFYKKALILDVLVEMREGLDSATRKLASAPDKLREALSFTFDSKIGFSLLDDGKELYSAMHDVDRVISSGLKSLDKLIEGGFHEKSLSLILAQANLGKSLIMCSLAVAALLQNKNILYISLEMSEEKISERMLANLFDIPMDMLKMMVEDKFLDKLKQIQQTIRSRLMIVAYPPKSVSANRIRSILKDLEIKKRYKPDMVYIDYLGLMIPNSSKKNDNSYGEQKTISEEVRGVAVEFGFPIVSAIQTNRAGFGSADLDMTDIADSIGIAATADIIIGVTQTLEFRENNTFCFSILKNRYGINQTKCYLGVDYPKMRVYNIEDEKPKISPEKVDRGEEIALSILKQDRKASQRKILIT